MYVVLNDKRLEIDGDLIEKQVAPFTTALGTGTTEWKNVAPHSTEEWRDLRGGLGMESEEAPTQKFYWSESIETTKEGELCLGPLPVNCASMGANVVKMVDFGSKVHALATGLVKTWDETNSDWDSADASGLANITDALVVTDNTNTYLLSCNGATVRGTAGTSYANTSTENLKYMTTFDKRLIGVDNAYRKIWYSPRENIDGTLAAFNSTGDYSAIQDIFSGKLLTTGEPCVYILMDTGLFALDYYTQTLHRMEVRFPATTNAKVGMYWNGYVYVSTGAGIVRITPNIISPWGPDQDDGLPTDYQGYVYDMIGISHWVVIAVSGGTKSSILKRHESLGGWHQVYSSSSNIRCLHWSPLHSPGRLWFQDGANIRYIQFPDKTHNVTSVSGYTYNAEGYLYLPVMSRVSSMPKIALAVDGICKKLSTNVKVTPYYQCNAGINTINTARGWTALGAWTTGARPSSAFGSSLGTSFYDIATRLKFETNSSANTPIVKAVALKYLPLPATVSAWVFTVKALGHDAKEIIDALATARDSAILVNFSPDGDTGMSEKYVRIMSMPSKRWLDRYAANKEFIVTVTEVS